MEILRGVLVVDLEEKVFGYLCYFSVGFVVIKLL